MHILDFMNFKYQDFIIDVRHGAIIYIHVSIDTQKISKLVGIWTLNIEDEF